MPEYVRVVVNAYTPKETVELVGRSGVIRANMRLDKMFISGVVAGMLLAVSDKANEEGIQTTLTRP